MRLEKEYQAILDRGFESHFPGWNEMSPLDPLKVFADSLASALSDIELRQNRFLTTILDTLPSLFGFHPKSAQIPTGFFSLPVTPKLVETKTLPSESRFRFSGENTVLQIQATEKLRLLPLAGLEVTDSGDSQLLAFSVQGPCPDLTLTFISDEAKASPGVLRSASLTVKPAGRSPELTVTPEFEDLTQNFTQSGHLRFYSDIVLFPERGSATLRLSFSEPPKGRFFLNTFRCQIFQLEVNQPIGRLTGEPWEEILLPSRALLPPDELVLQFPDDSSEVIPRIETDLLKLRHQAPDRFARAFFYNGASHSVIVPEAMTLLRNYNGGVIVRAKELKMAGLAWPSKAETAGAGDFATWIENVFPVSPELGFVPRETKSDYLNRFYSSLRVFSSMNQRSPGLVLEEIFSKLLDSEPSLRKVEANVDPAKKEVTFYLLTKSALPPSLSPLENDGVLSHVAERLSQIVPLDYRWSLEPFSPREVTVRCAISLRLEAHRLVQVTPTLVEERLNQVIRRCCTPVPSGGLAPGSRLSLEELAEEFRQELVIPRTDRSHLSQNELAHLRVLIVRPDGQFQDSLHRQSGELLLPRLEMDMERLSTEPNVGRIYG